MASKKLVRDLFIARQPLFRQLLAPQMVSSGATRLRLTTQLNGLGSRRQFSVFNEFSKKIKGEASKSQDFQQSVKELKEKAEELKGVKEDLKARLAELPLEILRW